jgi:hypothetical protein
MEWVLKLEARSGWGDVETIEVGRLERRVTGLSLRERPRLWRHCAKRCENKDGALAEP